MKINRILITVGILTLCVSCMPNVAEIMKDASHHTDEFEVLEVIRCEHEGYLQNSYIIEYEGSRAVVQDPINQSSYKKGDTINVLIMKMKVEEDEDKPGTLTFQVMP